MYSIAIPTELLLGHSPSVYSSLFYNSLMVMTPSFSKRSIPPQIRPCLMSTSFNINGLLESNDNQNCHKRNKKKVVFADDRGIPLTQVRIMSEPSNMPPIWTGAYMENSSQSTFFFNFEGKFTLPRQSLTAAFSSSKIGMQYLSKFTNFNFWEPAFIQPASNYLAFRTKLEKDSVSLENVIIRNNDNCFIGTVKVKNLVYDKTVTVRSTRDHWRSHEDVTCIYVEQPNLSMHTMTRNIYDTFRFCISLPLNDSNVCQIEFCVRYTIDGSDFWDNNAGANYVIKKSKM